MPQDDLSDLASLDLASLPEVQTTAFRALHAQQPLPIDRYLLFDAAELSSLHEQQGVLLFFLDLAMALGRTLVLPRCRLRRLLADGSPSAQPEFVPWSELFDLTTLSALHPAIPLESFVASHGRVDLLAVAAPESCAPTTDMVERDFNGLPALPVMRSECGVQRSAAALRSLSHAAIGFVGSTELLGEARDMSEFFGEAHHRPFWLDPDSARHQRALGPQPATEQMLKELRRMRRARQDGE